MNKTIDTNAFIRFFNDDCTADERQQIMQWVNASDDNAEQFFRWEEFYHLGKWHKVDDIALHKAEKALFARIKTEERRSLDNARIRRWMRHAAAVVLLLLVTGPFVWYFTTTAREDWICISTAMNETSEIVLPDSSRVWLNEHSTLRYPRRFREQERNLKLDGEAYFEVTKNPHRPFTVQGHSISVQVLGTKFNLRSAVGSHCAEASLIEGEIKVKGNRGEGAITLSPGQKVRLDLNTRQMKVSDTNAALDAIWHNKLISLQNADIVQIAEVLEKAYHVHIILAPDVDKTATYSGVLRRKDSIEDVMRLLQGSLHLQYRINGQNIHVSQQAN